MITFFSSVDDLPAGRSFMRVGERESSGDARSTSALITGLTVLSIISQLPIQADPKEPAACSGVDSRVGSTVWFLQLSNLVASCSAIAAPGFSSSSWYRAGGMLSLSSRSCSTRRSSSRPLLVERAHLRIRRQGVRRRGRAEMMPATLPSVLTLPSLPAAPVSGCLPCRRCRRAARARWRAGLRARRRAPLRPWRS